jgi:hypothetical protein
MQQYGLNNILNGFTQNIERNKDSAGSNFTTGLSEINLELKSNRSNSAISSAKNTI